MTLTVGGLTDFPTVILQPGSPDSASIIALQNWLVQNGFLTQAQMNTGPGVYGPATTAAVAALQQQLGVNTGSYLGYYGKETIATIQAEIDALTADVTPNPDQLGSLLIQEFETFSPTAYKDTDGVYRVGFGDSQYAISDGSGGWIFGNTVTSSTQVTKAAAIAELTHRLDTESNAGIPGIEENIGQSEFLSLSPLRQAVLEDIAWNYGSLPPTIIADFQSNASYDEIANDIDALASDNNGINAGRRTTEADLFRWDAPTNPPANSLVFGNDNPILAVAGTTTIITSSDLSVSESGYTDDQLVYKVTTPPTDGEILVDGTAASSFTQADIDNGLVTYQETGSSASSDYFIFSVADPAGAETAYAPFEIQIVPPQVSWSGPSGADPGGDWNAASNWITGAVPSSTDDAVINASGTYSVTSTENNEVGQLDIDNTSATLAVTNGTFTDYGALNNSGTIDVNGGTFIVNGVASGAVATIDGGGTLEFGAVSNVGVTFGQPESGYSFTALDDPLLPSGGTTHPLAINNAGQIVGYYNGNGYDHGFLYNNGSYTTLDYPGATDTELTGINDAGEIVGIYDNSSGGFFSFIYSDGSFTPLPSGFIPNGINDSDEIIGSYDGGSVIYSDEAFTTLLDPAQGDGWTASTGVRGINNKGEIVGDYNDYYSYPYLYSGGTYTTIDPPQLYLYGINDEGWIVGLNGYDSSVFVYVDGVNEHVASDYTPGGINDLGDIIVEPFSAYDASGVLTPSVTSSNVLTLGDPEYYSGTIYGFAAGDAIDLPSISYDSNGAAVLQANNVLQISESGIDYSINLDPSQSFSGLYFHIIEDASGASEIIVNSFQAFGLSIANGQSIVVSSGNTASATTVSSGGSLTVAGLAGGTIIDGTENVLSGALDYNAIINSGGQQYVSAGGVSNDATVADGGYQYIESSGVAFDTLVSDPGIQIVSAGATALDITVSGGEQDVYGIATGTTIEAGGTQIIESGGTAGATTIDLGGSEVVSAGAMDDSAIIANGGVQLVYGVANAPTISSGGTAVVAGGTDIGAELYSGGTAIISGGTLGLAAGAPGGSVDFAGVGAVLQFGGTAMPADLVIGGFAMGDTIDLAAIGFDSGGTATFSGNLIEITESGQTYDLQLTSGLFGSISLASDGSSGTDVTIQSLDAVVGSGQTLVVSSGQSLSNVAISSGGTLNIISGGTASNIDLLSGGIVSGLVVSSGSVLTVSTGSLFNTTVANGGTLDLADGVGGSGLTLNSGAVLDVGSGQSVADLFVSAGVIVEATAGGILQGTTVADGGTSLALSGGVVSGTIVDSGGEEIVSGGGTSIAATVSGGGLEAIFGLAIGTLVFGEEIIGSGGVSDGATVGGAGPAAQTGSSLALLGQYMAGLSGASFENAGASAPNGGGSAGSSFLAPPH